MHAPKERAHGAEPNPERITADTRNRSACPVARGKSQNPPICRYFLMPEEGLEPPRHADDDSGALWLYSAV